MFIMVMVIVGHGLGRPGGQAARSEEKGSLVELGDKPSGGHVCCTLDLLSEASLLWVMPGLLSLPEKLQRKFLGACSWEVAPMGPLCPRGSGRCH